MSLNRFKFSARAILLPAGCALAASAVYAGTLLSGRYAVSIPTLVNGGADTLSPGYAIRYGVLGQGLAGNAQSSGYANAGGFGEPARAMASPPAVNLSDAYVYPNPFKPNSPGRFRADMITFKRLPAEATIRIFAITGRLVAELHKTDRTVDHYEWSAVNDDGRKLASGVYIYYMTAPGGGKARGKFAVIR